ncbi:MAG: hypothetical protein ACR2NV_08470 [Thermoleophilaceae bacterium]
MTAMWLFLSSTPRGRAMLPAELSGEAARVGVGATVLEVVPISV